MAKQITTAWEVVKYSPLKDKYPPGEVQPHIFNTERTLRRSLFGEFWDTLEGDLITYGKIDEYSPGTTYALDAVVYYYGSTLKSKTADNSVNPCDDDGTNWEVADKFTTVCYNTLWLHYMRPFLAFLIASKCNAYTTYSMNASGTTTMFSDDSGIKTATFGEYAHLKKQLLSDIDEREKNLISYIKETKDSCDYTGVLFLENCKPDLRSPRAGRRFYFKN